MDEITTGIRGDQFRNFIKSLLQKGNLDDKYINYLTDKEGMDLYGQAFTNPSADERHNYEMFEKLGDATCNKVIVWYIFHKLPKLADRREGVMLLSRISHVLRSKDTFANIGISYGFEQFISSGVMMVKGGETKKVMTVKRNSVVEDCFEAFIGVTEWILDHRFKKGVGFVIVQDLITSILNEYPFPSIRYEDLFDPITRLKELFDYQKFQFKDGSIGGLGTYKYVDVMPEEDRGGNKAPLRTVCIEYTDRNGSVNVISRGQGAIKETAKEIAAEQALRVFKGRGFFKQPPYNHIDFL